MDSKLIVIFSLLVVSLTAAANGQCLRLSAALENDDELFFFFGHRYIAFDMESRREVHSGDVSEYFQDLPDGFRVDAAYTSPKNPEKKILISKDKYVEYSSDGHSRSDVKPLTNFFPLLGRNTFSENIDAAVLYGGDVYYFRGCRVILFKSDGSKDLFDENDKKYPCNIDAAWVKGDYMVITKGIHAWVYKGQRRLNKRPGCFANPFKTSENICKCRIPKKKKAI